MTEKARPGIRYVLGDKQAGVSWADDRDNPLSPGFVPLTDRTEIDKVRWWARMSKRRRTPTTHVVYDP